MEIQHPFLIPQYVSSVAAGLISSEVSSTFASALENLGVALKSSGWLALNSFCFSCCTRSLLLAERIQLRQIPLLVEIAGFKCCAALFQNGDGPFGCQTPGPTGSHAGRASVSEIHPDSAGLPTPSHVRPTSSARFQVFPVPRPKSRSFSVNDSVFIGVHALSPPSLPYYSVAQSSFIFESVFYPSIDKQPQRHCKSFLHFLYQDIFHCLLNCKTAVVCCCLVWHTHKGSVWTGVDYIANLYAYAFLCVPAE